ncbi:hypothetical protein Ocin01_09690 [Orchesella cincta]|uniref:Uncharacterized protein n=1 Tax=Orchesella cincta TaxID=48709 RepID=A0A1D2MVF6_ORCCI|nr:hypothetical protein Ocin01_09690 [Orchesella cincta]
MPIQKWIDPKWTKYIRCGPDASPGLSVLDVDNINYLYNCQGCQRHRWIPAASLSHEDFSNMPTFGYESENKNPIFACRAQHQAEIVSGMYDHSSKTCKISWANKPYEISDPFEILTIPGGVVGNDCSVYKPVNWRNGLDPENSLVYVVGNILYQPYWNCTSHIAYARVSGSNVVGKIWLERGVKFSLEAEIYTGTSSSRTGEYQVLTCGLDKNCMLKQIFGHKAFSHQDNFSA